MDFVDLEIVLGRYYSEAPAGDDSEERIYTASVRWHASSSLVDNNGEMGLVRFDWWPLVGSRTDPAKHGKLLADALFLDARIRDPFLKARGFANPNHLPVRLRIFISRDVPELHDLRWETMRDPEEPDHWLLTDERILFSRYLTSSDNRHIPVRRKGGGMRGLVIVANPKDGKEAPIDVEGEIARARASIGSSVELDILASDPEKPVRVTRDAVREALRRTPAYDIVYLVCHGRLPWDKTKTSREPLLLLETPEGAPDYADGAFLVERIASALEQPRLIVLASCQSGGPGGPPVIGEEGVLAALGPRLVSAGAGAVIAMQGDFTMDTAKEFLPRFFQGVQDHGEVDRAITEARGKVVDRSDSWMPALYSRLREGRIWYEPRFAGEGADSAQRWDTMRSEMKKGRCLPILGPGLTERLFGTSAECARRLAQARAFPLADRYNAEWAQVAQFVHVIEGPDDLRDWLTEYWQARLNHFSHGESHEEFIDRVRAIGKQRRGSDPEEAHVLLAKLPIPIYVTCNQDTWMEDALIEQGRTPVVEYLRWKQELRGEGVYDEKATPATVERPLVYHLLGTIEEPRSLVLTEDDYFEYLTASSKIGNLPSNCAAAWSSHVLLFLGFELMEWQSRLLFHSILDEERRSMRYRSKKRAVAVQVSPDEGVQEPRAALQYFQQYFRDAVTDMYAGRADDFLLDLWKQLGGLP